MIQDLHIYGLNLRAIVFSAVNNINPALQTVVLVLTIIYKQIKIL